MRVPLPSRSRRYQQRQNPLSLPAIHRASLVDTIVSALATSPELWHQRAYLARVVTLDPERGPRDAGIVPLAAFVDGGGDDGSGDAIAVTLEADGTGAIYPVVYVRRGGRFDEHMIEPDILLRYETDAVRRRLEQLVRGLGG